MNKKLSTQIMMILLFGAIMLGMSIRTPMWMDEYCFYRLSLGLPDYKSTADWFLIDRPAMLSPSIDWESRGLDRDTQFRLVYDTPVYPHIPLVPILVSPLVKGLGYLANQGIIPHIEDEVGYPPEAAKDHVAFANMKAELITNILRLVSIGLVMITMWLIFRIMREKVGKNAYFFALPVAMSVNVLYGAFLFYWDVFMMFFFVLTLYLMDVKPESRWKYVTACCLVNTKMFIGMAFLFPLFVEQFKRDITTGWKFPFPGWKMALPLLSIIPFYIITVVVTRNPLYLWEHYAAQVPLHDFIYTLNTTVDYVNIFFAMGMPGYILLTLPVVFYVKKYPSCVIFWVMSMVYAWATGLGITHTSTMAYSGALVVPLVANELHIIERVQGYVKKGKQVLRMCFGAWGKRE